MSDLSHGRRTNEGRRRADAARFPVLARLPDASTEPPAIRSTQLTGPGGVEYRFDPPQQRDTGSQSPAGSQPKVGQPPHVRERVRAIGQRGIPRGESPVLPRTNPFANPRPRLVDSLAPAVRFLTMVALFTAAGVWFQTFNRHGQPAQAVELPKTANQPAPAPAKNAADHTVPMPTATGPIESHPEPDARVGRAGGNGFTSQDNTAAGPVPTGSPSASP